MSSEPVPEDYLQPSEISKLENGPMGPLVEAVRSGHRVLVALRSNRKIYGDLKAIDRHWNMILENVFEIWSPQPTPDKKTVKPQTRRIKCLFVRGDNVICAYPNPKVTE